MGVTNYNSHIALCQALMRPYKVKINGDEVFYWDLSDGEIKHKRMRLLDAESMYYEPIIEEYLANKIEAPFFYTVNDLKKWHKGEKSLESVINEKSLYAIRDFFRLTFLRKKEVFEKVNEYSSILQLVKGFTPSVLIAVNDAFENPFNDKQISIIINRSDVNFVCPHNVVYDLYNEIKKSHLLTITINRKIALCISVTDTNKNVDIFETDDIATVELINLATYLTERNSKTPYIVGCESDLIRLREQCSIYKNESPITVRMNIIQNN